MTRNEILAEFLKLDPDEQRQLVEEMWESMEEEDVSHEFSDEELVEIERRDAEFRADPSTGIPWENVRAELRKRHD